MNQAEFLGAKLTMLIRRQAGELAAWQETEDKINELYRQIQTMDAGALYAHTAEIPVVREPADPEVTMIHPRLPDDTATEQMTLIVMCPVHCRVQVPHTHLADGKVAWV